MIELAATLAILIACRRLRRAVREPRRLDVHVHHHGLPGGPGEPVDPSANVVAFRPRRAS
jgi:hypothetical protein